MLPRTPDRAEALPPLCQVPLQALLSAKTCLSPASGPMLGGSPSLPSRGGVQKPGPTLIGDDSPGLFLPYIFPWDQLRPLLQLHHDLASPSAPSCFPPAQVGCTVHPRNDTFSLQSLLPAKTDLEPECEQVLPTSDHRVGNRCSQRNQRHSSSSRSLSRHILSSPCWLQT